MFDSKEEDLHEQQISLGYTLSHRIVTGRKHNKQIGKITPKQIHVTPTKSRNTEINKRKKILIENERKNDLTDHRTSAVVFSFTKNREKKNEKLSA